MSIAIRPADLDIDKDLIVDTLRRYLNPTYDDIRFDWLYRKNPCGQARTWIAEDTELRTAIGVAGAFPRTFCVEGEKRLCWMLGDFCVNDQYRSLGPALQLQRACLADTAASEIAFWYDFPSTQMMAIYKRLGISVFGDMVRLAKLLRIDEKVKEVVKISGIADGLCVAGNLFLALGTRRLKRFDDATVALHEGNCGEEFSALFRLVSNRGEICAWRSAEYLNWRYVDNPLYPYHLVTVRLGGILVAYAVFMQSGDEGLLVDLFGIGSFPMMRSLVHNTVTLLQQRNVSVIHTIIPQNHRWLTVFRSVGFRKRESSSVVVGTPQGTNDKAVAATGPNWLLMYGDRDA